MELTPSFYAICENCGKKYFTTKSVYTRSKTHCCSRVCTFARQKRYTLTIKANRKCVICGNQFHIPKSWLSKSGNRGKYCSKECRWKIKDDYTKQQKNKARNTVRIALEKGAIVKSPCEVCGDINVQAHHYLGYSSKHLLTIKWLCYRHHNQEHEELRSTSS